MNNDSNKTSVNPLFLQQFSNNNKRSYRWIHRCGQYFDLPNLTSPVSRHEISKGPTNVNSCPDRIPSNHFLFPPSDESHTLPAASEIRKVTFGYLQLLISFQFIRRTRVDFTSS